MGFLLDALVFLLVDLARPIPVGYVDILLWAIFYYVVGDFSIMIRILGSCFVPGLSVWGLLVLLPWGEGGGLAKGCFAFGPFFFFFSFFSFPSLRGRLYRPWGRRSGPVRGQGAGGGSCVLVFFFCVRCGQLVLLARWCGCGFRLALFVLIWFVGLVAA